MEQVRERERERDDMGVQGLDIIKQNTYICLSFSKTENVLQPQQESLDWSD
jgi:hypothetical protein